MDLSFVFEPLMACSVGLQWSFAFVECTDVRSEVSVYVGPVDNRERRIAKVWKWTYLHDNLPDPRIVLWQ